MEPEVDKTSKGKLEPDTFFKDSTLFCDLVNRQECSRLTAIRLNSSPSVRSGGIETQEPNGTMP